MTYPTFTVVLEAWRPEDREIDPREFAKIAFEKLARRPEWGCRVGWSKSSRIKTLDIAASATNLRLRDAELVADVTPVGQRGMEAYLLLALDRARLIVRIADGVSVNGKLALETISVWGLDLIPTADRPSILDVLAFEALADEEHVDGRRSGPVTVEGQ